MGVMGLYLKSQEREREREMVRETYRDREIHKALLVLTEREG